MRGQPCNHVIALSCPEGQFYLSEDMINEHYLHGVVKTFVYIRIGD